MTVLSTEFFTDWRNGNGANKNWSYDFRIATLDSIFIEYREGSDGAVIRTQADLFWSPTDENSGYVQWPVTGPALAAGWQTRIIRIVPAVQPIEIGNEGPFHPDLHEKAFDNLTMMVQQVSFFQEQLGSVEDALAAAARAEAAADRAEAALWLTPFDRTTAFTVTDGMNHGLGRVTTSGPINITLPQNRPVGFNTTFIQLGTGRFTFVTSGAATMFQKYGWFTSENQYAVVSAIVRANAGGNAAIWHITGDVGP